MIWIMRYEKKEKLRINSTDFVLNKLSSHWYCLLKWGILGKIISGRGRESIYSLGHVKGEVSSTPLDGDDEQTSGQ